MNCLKCSKTYTCYDWSKYVYYFIKNARAVHHLRQVLNMRSPFPVLDNEDIYVTYTVLPCQDFMNLNVSDGIRRQPLTNHCLNWLLIRSQNSLRAKLVPILPPGPPYAVDYGWANWDLQSRNPDITKCQETENNRSL